MPDTSDLAGGLRLFFERLAALSAASDVEGLAAMYAPMLLVAGASGARVVSSGDILRAIPKRKEYLASLGHLETTLAAFDEQMLTDRYWLVRAEWRWTFQQSGAFPKVVTLPSTFIVDRAGDAPHIILYVNDKEVRDVLVQQSAGQPMAHSG